MSPRHAPAIALAAALAAQGCALLVGIEVLSNRGAPGPIPCQVPTDCPVGGNVCFVRTCVGGICGLNEAPAGTPVVSQIAGDCKQVRCTADGRTEEVVTPDDFASDGEECTDDECVDGVPSHPPKDPGTRCESGGICSPFGRCVRCLEGPDNAQCKPGVEVCLRGVCALLGCTDGAQNGDETDVDCGGPGCPQCDEGARCGGPDDCAGGVCEDGRCAAPSCEDGAQNGDESDLDCGGPACARCADGELCRSADDCQSGVCGATMNDDGSVPTCAKPTCSDAVRNGDELAPDCGGICAGTCNNGDPCADNDDCFSQVCDKFCQPSCFDGEQNGTEEGVDCGGECPTPCPESPAPRAR